MTSAPEHRDARSLLGYRVAGRHGSLGVVVELVELDDDLPLLLAEGGTSGALVFHVPLSAVERVDDRERTVWIDEDVTSFVPSLREDGRVQLLLRD